MVQNAIQVYEGRNFSVSLRSMLGSTNYGWSLTHLPKGVVLIGTEIANHRQGIMPVDQIFYFGAEGLNGCEEEKNLRLTFAMVCYSDFRKCVDEVDIDVMVMKEKNDKKVEIQAKKVQYANNSAIYNTAMPYGYPFMKGEQYDRANQMYGYICCETNTKYGYPNCASVETKYGYPNCGEKRPALKYGFPCCGEEQSINKYGYPNCEEHPVLKYGYPNCEEEQPVIKYGYPNCEEEQPVLKYGYPNCEEEQPVLKYGYPNCEEEQPVLKYGYPNCEEEQPVVKYGYPNCEEDITYESVTNEESKVGNSENDDVEDVEDDNRIM